MTSDPGTIPSEAGRLAAELIECWNSHDSKRAEALYAPDYEGVDVGQAEPHRGPQGASQRMANYLHAFPDLSFTQDKVIIEGDHVAMLWTLQGTHEGRLMNIPPTGRKVAVRGVSLLTVKEGKIIRGTYVWDVAGLLREIKLLPEL